MDQELFLSLYRHSIAHVLAKAVIEIYGKENVQYAIGPQISDGCYYDFVLPRAVTEDDYQLIENKMNDIYQNSSTESAMFDFMELATEYKKVWMNCYKSRGHERMSKFAGEKIRSLIIRTFEAEGCLDTLPPQDLEIICTFYEEAFFGLMIRWLKDKLSDDPVKMKQSLNRIRVLFNGQLDLLAANSQNN